MLVRKDFKGEMALNQSGKLIEKIWSELASQFKNIDLDYHVVMPNHLHGIIFINSEDRGLINQTPVLRKITLIVKTISYIQNL